MYAKDISRKVKSAKRLRMHKGYYISCQPPYGYKVNPNDPNQLVIDEEVIDIVKKWLAQGHELDKDHLAKELGNYIKMLEHS